MSIELVFNMVSTAVTVTVMIVGLKYQLKEITEKVRLIERTLGKIISKELIAIGDYIQKHELRIKQLEKDVGNIKEFLNMGAAAEMDITPPVEPAKPKSPRQRAIEERKND